MSLFSAASFNTNSSIKETTSSCLLYTKISPTAKKTTTTRVVVVSKSTSGDDGDDDVSSSGSRGSGTTARGRRLLKVREEKRKREFDRLNNYPSWAKYLFIIHFISFHFYYSVVLANTSMEYNPLYDADKGFNVMPSSFHDVGDVEFQDNWGQVWVDIGMCCSTASRY
ncbi:hypothetical protein Tco_1460982 [Tanacetum coccineum]